MLLDRYVMRIHRGAALEVGYHRNGLTYWQGFEKYPQINMTTLTDFC